MILVTNIISDVNKIKITNVRNSLKNTQLNLNMPPNLVQANDPDIEVSIHAIHFPSRGWRGIYTLKSRGGFEMSKITEEAFHSSQWAEHQALLEAYNIIIVDLDVPVSGCSCNFSQAAN